MIDLNRAIEPNEQLTLCVQEKSELPGSSGEFIGLEGSSDKSPDRSPRLQTDKPGYAKESKLAAHIAETLRNTLGYDELGGEWYIQPKSWLMAFHIGKKRAQIHNGRTGY